MTAKVFISHVSSDKDAVARPLAKALGRAGHEVWFDEFSLDVGDNLRESVEAGLASCDVGVVIISEKFFERLWTNEELSGLFAREVPSRKIILPVWHGVTAEDVKKKAPMLSGRLAVRTSDGMPTVIDRLNRAIARRMQSAKTSLAGLNALPYCIIASIKGSKIIEELRRFLPSSTGIDKASIKNVRVVVSDDLSCVFDYDGLDSFFELKSGTRIGITNEQVMEAARRLATDIPERYEAYGIGYPEYSGMDQNAREYPLEKFTCRLVLMPDPATLQKKDFAPFLEGILSCTACETSYFWGPGSAGQMILERFLETGSESQLAAAILAHVPSGRSGLIDLGLAFIRDMPDSLKSPAGGRILAALLQRKNELTAPLVKDLTTMLAPTGASKKKRAKK